MRSASPATGDDRSKLARREGSPICQVIRNTPRTDKSRTAKACRGLYPATYPVTRPVETNGGVENATGPARAPSAPLTRVAGSLGQRPRQPHSPSPQHSARLRAWHSPLTVRSRAPTASSLTHNISPHRHDQPAASGRPAVSPGGPRPTNGSRPPLSRIPARIRSTTAGSVITETIFISTRQRGHRSGSTSRIFRSSRAQLARRLR